jgi:hypothetical protein
VYLFKANGTIPIVGDWNGDGKTDIGITNGQKWYLDINGNGIWDDPTSLFGAP